MFSQKNIVVTIGDVGAVFVVYDGQDIKDRVFLNELNDASKKELESILEKNKSAPIFILLDNTDQSYRKKTYPVIRKGDLIRIIKRDMSSDGDVGSLKNYVILNSGKTTKNNLPAASKRQECLFVSSSISQITAQWIDFLSDFHNRLVGIYMLPIESFTLFKSLKIHIKKRSKIQNKKNDLYCLVMQNKTSGMRQIVFSDQGIVFTRAINYDAAQVDYLEKYEQDIYSTFEYLKRVFPDISIKEIDIVNILPTELLEPIKNLNNIELNFVNYTPFEAASQIKINDKFLSESSSSCDLLISKVFAKDKKVLKFTTPKISILEKFFFTIQASYFINTLLVLGCLATFVVTIFSLDEINKAADEAESKKFDTMQLFNKSQRLALEGSKLSPGASETNTADIEKITDFGKMEEVLGASGENFGEFYIKLKFLKNFNIKLNTFSYSLADFNGKNPIKSNNFKISASGKIFNKSGDIEDLFKEFDNVGNELKKNFAQNQIKYSDLPKNMDFNKKYYDFPIDFSISKKP